MDRMSTKFGADSSSHFPFIVWTNRQTDATERYTAGVGNNIHISFECSYAVARPINKKLCRGTTPRSVSKFMLCL